MYNKNSVGKVIFNIGVLQIIAGFILGIIMGTQSYETEWPVIIQWWIVGFVSGIVFIGFSEVIELLHKIAIKLGVEHPTSSKVDEDD